jgi:hypothetical protein
MPEILDWLEAAGRVASSFQASPDGTPQRVWQELGPWFSRLSQNAAKKWLPRILGDLSCQVPLLSSGMPSPCTRHAIAACDVCGRNVCLEHARVDHRGEAICFPCIAAAMKAAKQNGQSFFDGNTGTDRGYENPPPPPGSPGAQNPNTEQARREALREAYKIIGVKQSCTDAELKSAYKKLAVKWHPDKYTDPVKKADAETKIKRINRAHDFIVAERERASK